jgi:2-polyprenyl-3-methyl-5-hydroxy-6-metoxy-1,4-benzoquinol methylase
MSAQNTIEIQQFFDGQDTYAIAMRENYMKHQEIIGLLTERFGNRKPNGLSLLEIGCGDAWVVGQLAQNTPVKKYIGIDLAENSLQRAKMYLQPRIEHVELIQGDYVEKVKTLTEKFDLVLAGYVIHHLQTPDKKAVLGILKDMLTPNGSLLIYDVTMTHTESRAEFNSRTVDYYDLHWTALTSAQLFAIREHITTYDFPESLETWISLAADNGLELVSTQYLDQPQFYSIIEFKRVDDKS